MWWRYEFYNHVNILRRGVPLPLPVPALTPNGLPFILPPAGKQGICRLVTWIDNTERTEREVSYSIIPRPPTTASDLSSSLGISGHYFEPQLKMLQRMGVKWNRAESPSVFCRWGYAEPQENVFVFFDSDVQLANTYGVATMCTLGTNRDCPAWAANGSLPDLNKWRAFVSGMVS